MANDIETEAYAAGRAEQFADDCAVVRLLLENCDDIDAESDGRMNTTRIRELLSHFAAPQSPSVQQAPKKGPRIDLGRYAGTYGGYRSDDEKGQQAAATEASATGAEPAEFEKTFPDHIWLDAGEAMEFADPGDTFRDLQEVTWSEDNATGYGVKYIRADLASGGGS